MRASASLLIFATALSSFSGVSGSVIPHPPPTESDLVDVDEQPHFRVGVPVPPPVNTPSPKPMVKPGKFNLIPILRHPFLLFAMLMA